jgi:hypothetical protein
VSLRAFIDRSIVEVYAQGGLGVVTSRIYPTPRLPDSTPDPGQTLPDWDTLGAWGYELRVVWPAGGVQAEVAMYDVDSCWEQGSE